MSITPVDENNDKLKIGNMAKVFPQTKIKGLIREEEGIGQLYRSAVELVAASSAIFVEQLSSTAIQIAKNEAVGDEGMDETNSKHDQPLVITLKHLQQSGITPWSPSHRFHDTTQQCSHKFEFLNDILEGGYKSIPSYHQIFAKKNATDDKKRKKENSNLAKRKIVEIERSIDKADTDGSLLRDTKLIKVETAPDNSNKNDHDAQRKDKNNSISNPDSEKVDNENQGNKPYTSNIIIQDEEDYD